MSRLHSLEKNELVCEQTEANLCSAKSLPFVRAPAMFLDGGCRGRVSRKASNTERRKNDEKQIPELQRHVR